MEKVRNLKPTNMRSAFLREVHQDALGVEMSRYILKDIGPSNSSLLDQLVGRVARLVKHVEGCHAQYLTSSAKRSTPSDGLVNTPRNLLQVRGLQIL